MYKEVIFIYGYAYCLDVCYTSKRRKMVNVKFVRQKGNEEKVQKLMEFR